MMIVRDEDYWDVEYWDEFVDEFGIEAYIEARYTSEIDRQAFRELLEEVEDGVQYPAISLPVEQDVEDVALPE